MKALIILAILITIAITFFKYTRDKDTKKLLIALASFAMIISLAVVGNLTRSVIPLYISHLLLVIVAWIGVLWYVLKGKYYWWIIFSPLITIGLFLLLEFLEGSRHGILG